MIINIKNSGNILNFNEYKNVINKDIRLFENFILDIYIYMLI